MIRIANNEEIKAYYDDPSMNQSLLKTLEFGVANYMKALEKQKKPEDPNNVPIWLKIGSAVDTIITQGTDMYFEKFYVSNFENLPSEKERLITKGVLDKLLETKSDIDSISTLDMYYLEIVEVARSLEYQNRWGDEAIIKSILKSCSRYFEMLKESIGKTILSVDENEVVMNAVERLKQSDLVRNALGIDNEDSNNIFAYQVALYFNLDAIRCKALLDCVNFEFDMENKKIIVRPYDLKTTSSPVMNFEKSFYNYRYDLQAAFYTIALKTVLTAAKLNKELQISEMDISDFEISIENFKFVVVDVTSNSKPIIVEVSQETLENAVYNDEERMSLKTLVCNFTKHQTLNDYDNDIRMIDSNFSVVI